MAEARCRSLVSLVILFLQCLITLFPCHLRLVICHNRLVLLVTFISIPRSFNVPRHPRRARFQIKDSRGVDRRVSATAEAPRPGRSTELSFVESFPSSSARRCMGKWKGSAGFTLHPRIGDRARRALSVGSEYLPNWMGVSQPVRPPSGVRLVRSVASQGISGSHTSREMVPDVGGGAQNEPTVEQSGRTRKCGAGIGVWGTERKVPTRRFSKGLTTCRSKGCKDWHYAAREVTASGWARRGREVRCCWRTCTR